MECSSSRLDSLRECCDSLSRLSNEQSKYKLNDSDNLGFMSLCFLSKQIDHMDAVMRLFPHQDMQLISRAMIEGLHQLLWCFNKPERAFQWRGFSWISDWRLSRELEAKGQETPPELKRNINAFISQHGELYKFNKYKNKPIPESVDPFHKNWRCGKQLNEISAEVQGENLYKVLYSPYSDWQHWGVSTMGQMIKRDEDGISYGEHSDPGYKCSALAVSFLCLYQVMELNNSHHNLGLDDKLSKIKEAYIKMHLGDEMSGLGQ